MTDFGALPPEVNSARLHTGPGAAPLLGAAAAWERLSAELHSARAACGSAINQLTASWQGPSATRMAAAAQPYLQWLSTTAVQAEQTAVQARDAATAYTTALAATVPPAAITANRAHRAALSAGNIFGQHTAAMAADDSDYAGMWSQNAAAMHGYAAQAADAARLTPFAAPPQATAPAATAGPTGSALAALDGFITGPLAPGSLFVIPSTPEFLGIDTLGVVMEGGPAPEAGVVRSAWPSGVLASAGRAGFVGRLSVPPTWSTAAPTIKAAATLVPRGMPPVPAAALAGDAPAALLGGAAGSAVGRAAVNGATTAPSRGPATTANIFFLQPGADATAVEGTS